MTVTAMDYISEGTAERRILHSIPFIFVLTVLGQHSMFATTGVGFGAVLRVSRQPSINASNEAHILTCIVFKGCGPRAFHAHWSECLA